MKTFGAFIRCATCDAQPYPDNPTTTRESFDLVKISDSWLCERCRPAGQKRAPRIVAVTPLAALSTFEDLFAASSASFEEALAEDCAALLADFGEYSIEIERGLTELRKAFAAQKPPASPDEARVQPRRAPKKIKAKERLGDGQRDWTVEDGQSAQEDSP